MKNLKEKRLILSHEYKQLAHNFNDVSKQLFKNQVCKARFGDELSIHHSEEVKQVAVTLHHCFPKACDCLCRALLLPHPTGIRTWVASDDCEPGFFCDVIKLVDNMAQVK